MGSSSLVGARDLMEAYVSYVLALAFYVGSLGCHLLDRV